MKIKQMPPNIVNKMSVSEYPESGVYFDGAGYYLIDKYSSIFWMLSPSNFTNIFGEVKQSKEPTPIDDILKVIAVTRKPELINELRD